VKKKTAMRIDLWTKEMMVDEMADFFYQTLMTMADTYNRATHQQELTDELKDLPKTFIKISRLTAKGSERKYSNLAIRLMCVVRIGLACGEKSSTLHACIKKET
jgi:hypothetical protein